MSMSIWLGPFQTRRSVRIGCMEAKLHQRSGKRAAGHPLFVV